MSTAIESSDIQIDHRRAVKNTVILSICQCLYIICISSHIVLGTLVGSYLLPAALQDYATLPISINIVGNAITIIPASMFMRRYGRRVGFMVSAAFGTLAMGMAAVSIFMGSFMMFCVASAVLGIFQGFATYYRFAAADTASEAFRPKAISWVLAGGVIAALLGPQIVAATHDLLAPVKYAGGYAALIVVGLIAIGMASLVDIPMPSAEEAARPGRSLFEIVSQPVFIVAALCGVITYALMSFMMTATPIAMRDHGFDLETSSRVIGFHVLAMFGPSFFTGNLISRFGAPRIIIAGLLLLIVCAGIAMSGTHLMNFTAALILLGLGWNFGFVGATALLTTTYRPEEKSKAQPANDFLVFGTVAAASFGSGKVLASLGWYAVAVGMVVPVLIALGLIIWLMMHQKADTHPA